MSNTNNTELQMRDRIFARLKELNYTQREFAEKLQISPQTITDWKKGKSFSFSGMSLAIAEALDTTVEYLLTGNGPKQDEAFDLERITDHIRSTARQIKNAVDSTYRFYLSISNLVGGTTPVPRDIVFNTQKTDVIESEIFRLISNYMKIATPEEKNIFWEKYKNIGIEYLQAINNPEETPYPTSEEMESYLDMFESSINESKSSENDSE